MDYICYNNKLTNFKDFELYSLIDQNNKHFFSGLDNNNEIHLSQIIGVLKLSSKQFKTTKTKNYIMKEFEPFDPNIPNFMVKTNKIHDKNDKYVIVKLVFDNKSIFGLIEQYLGVVGDILIEKEICSHFALSNWNKKINKLFDKTNIGISETDITPERNNMTSVFTVSIDPIGSLDIDDSIGIEFSKDLIHLSIHIADPSSYILENSLLDIEIAKRCESVYLHDKTYHMFPDFLSTTLFSLREQEDKRAFSVILTLSHDYTIIDTQITKSIINVNHNMSYDNCQNIINDKKDDSILSVSLKKMYDIGYSFYKSKYNITEIQYDIKKMIEIFMIFANNIIAEKLIELNVNYPIIIRAQKSQNINEHIDQYEYNDDYINLQRSNAILKIYNENTNNRHDTLNLDAYTHFTSPIRRYSDILVHRILYNLLSQTNTFSLDNILNNKKQLHQMFCMNYYKQFYKKITNLEKEILITHKIIETIGYYPNDRIISAKGIVLHINEIDNNIKIIKVKCLNIEDNDNKFIDEYFINNINTIKTDENINLFEIIQYKICFLNNSIKKIKAYL